MALAQISGAIVSSVKKTIGFFGGSFDPIHFGHLNLAIHILEKGGLDEILFCPAFYSPFGNKALPEASAEHRLHMLKSVLTDVPRCSVTSLEVDRKGPSYTVDTLRHLQRTGVQLRLLLSEESAARFFEWKDAKEILQLAPPLIGSRVGGLLDSSFQQWTVETPLFDISSTDVRSRLMTKKYCGHLVPTKALDYIAQHSLYSQPYAKKHS